MRLLLVGLLVLASCTQGSGGAPLYVPGIGQGRGMTDASDLQRRGAVEIAVKSGYPVILDEITSGGGPALGAAMEAAGIPAGDRPARIIQLQSDMALYEVNPGALVSALIVYGSTPS